jgi:hypothetical protein
VASVDRVEVQKARGLGSILQLTISKNLLQYFSHPTLLVHEPEAHFGGSSVPEKGQLLSYIFRKEIMSSLWKCMIAVLTW